MPMKPDPSMTNNGMHPITKLTAPPPAVKAAVAAAAPAKSIAQTVYPEPVGLRGRPIAKPEEKKP